jgi:hypothetical protein
MVPSVRGRTTRLLAIAALGVATHLLAGPASLAQQSLTPKRLALRRPGLEPRIVNGSSAVGQYPEVGLLIRTDNGSICTGTLIGCNTFLTAAHCIADSFSPAAAVVFFQHRGFVFVSGGVFNPDWIPFVESDVAVITLASTVTGIAPFPINTVAEPPNGTLVDIVGFGSIGDADPSNANLHAGILRRGDAVTSSCATVPNESHVCFSFLAPVGPPGSDSSTCFGDSGGPMFGSVPGLGPAVVGVASGVSSTNCMPPNVPFHADVGFDHQWIVDQAAGDLAPIQCGTLPTALGAGTSVGVDDGSLTQLEGGALYVVDVEAGLTELRITINGELIPAQNYDLWVNRGSPPVVVEDFDCGSIGSLSFESCNFPSPVAGDYYILVDNSSASSGEYQITVTGFGGPVPTWTPTVSPTPSPTPPAPSTPTATATPTASPTPTITPTVGPCTPLDVDGDGALLPLADGLLFLRYGFGFTGTALTSGALGPGATRDAAAIVAFLDGCGDVLDIDGNGAVLALTDGLLFLRYLFGFSGPPLIAGATADDCTRCTAGEIEAYLATLVP